MKPHLDTPTRARFFEAIDRRGKVGQRSICQQFNISYSTGKRLLHDRDTYGSLADHRSRLRQHKQAISGVTPGRPRKVSDRQLQSLLQAPPNVRSSKLDDQISRAGISASTRTVQRALRSRCNAAIYRAAKSKSISPTQAQQRHQYCEKYRVYPIHGFWDGVIFTDEAHMSLSELPPQNILRVRGERFKPKNILNTQPKTATDVHFAAWINYYDRAVDLVFYNDEFDDIIIKKPPPKPRRRPTTETDNEYQVRVAEWEANKARNPIISRPGNSMCGQYYTRNILPIYRDAYYSLLSRSDLLRSHLPPDRRYNWYLVEDNDPSHGTRNLYSAAGLYRSHHNIQTLPHPANSPDFNPIESLWELIKERVKRNIADINTIEDLKTALQTEWRNITQQDCQRRIQELPKRLRQAYQTPESRVKTRLW